MRRVAAALLCLNLTGASGPYPDFRNVAASAGLTQSIPNGGDQSKQFIVETTGSGVAFIDYDNDGLPDIFLVSGPGAPSRMYHNEGGGQFRDATEQLGMRSSGWGQGVCAGDYDNDGFTDLFVTYWGQNPLYRNIGGRRFEDVTAKTHLTQDRIRYNTGCAFIDYDNDGKLDLFVANYLKFDPRDHAEAGRESLLLLPGMAVNCGPRGLPFDRNILYHNEGDAFRDVSDESGISKPDRQLFAGRADRRFQRRRAYRYLCGLRPDAVDPLYQPRQRKIRRRSASARRGSGRQRQRAVRHGRCRARITCAKDLPSIFRTNFSDELYTLYRNRGKGDFEDESVGSGFGQNTRFVGWGCGFLRLR